MAFSEKAKNELVRVIPKARCCRLAELRAFYDFNGFLMGKEAKYLDFYNSSPVVARKILSLLKSLFPEITTQILVQQVKLRRSQTCTVRVLKSCWAKEVYNELQTLTYLENDLRVLRKKCCRRAYIRGAFLSHGSVTNPEKTYHFEISSDKTETANRVIDTIQALGIEARLTTRKETHVVYLKDGDQIVQLLNMMGAHSSLLELENIRIVKGMRNQVNRLVNCETANVDKTVQASMAQVEDIQRIDRHIGLENLPPKLYEIAKLRLENPYASLKELGEMSVPKMSKSGVNYRIRQIRAMSKRLSGLD